MTFTPSRRHFLLGASAAAALFASGSPALPAAAADPYQELLARRREFLTGGSLAASHVGLAAKRAAIDETVSGLLATFERTPGRTYLWPELPVNGAGNTAEVGNLGVTANQVTVLATAWASAGSRYHDDPDLLADLQGALAFLSGQYRADRSRPGNWWFWEIGLPRQLADTLTLLGANVPAQTLAALMAAVRFHAPDPNVRRGSTLKETGANRVDKALSCIVRGLLTGSDADVTLGRDALSDVAGGGRNSLFNVVTSGDGFYADGSFVQHGYLPYSGTYGGVAITGVAEVLAMLAGSRWAVTDANLANLLDAVDTTFAPFQWDVRTMDATRGRAVSRQAERDYDSGFAIASAVLVLAESAPAEQRSRHRALVKGWLERTTDQSVATNDQTLAASARSLAVLEDAGVPAGPARTGTTNTYNQERVVHHRGDWAAVVNTSSRRIGRYEWGNRENNLGWYQGDGVLFVYHREDPAQFSADFWPTVDPYALPGITVNGESRASGEADGTGIPRAGNTYAGGLTVGGEIGTTAMDLTNATGTLTANKSWYFLSGSVVCVGSNIADTSGTGVRTIAENRAFAVGARPVVRIDGRPAMLTEDLAPARNVHVAGHAGFVALTAPGRAEQRFGVRAERRTGTWQAINSGGDTAGSADEVSRDYVRIEHHHESEAGWYAYEVLPLATLGETMRRPRVSVLLAEDLAHLIETLDGARMGHFFAAGAWAGYTVSGPCAVGHRQVPAAPGSGGPAQVRTEVVISQPTKSGGQVTVEFPFDAPGAVVDADATVTVLGKTPLSVRVDASTPRGAEHRITFGGRRRR
ncbi:sugar isomerase [Occultella glacieicola]|uniref:Sugar isomerase n=1 Tax=Occultella glacieicola TaxID=2518684 RepID=A0ABY2DZN2_9MICO|nr:polysaccharide lyase family 8 super-sandwich domain-containing protein [Occultella glacieicola]TDE88818.1 sugar isomerase [Occultella glacieicola]